VKLNGLAVVVAVVLVLELLIIQELAASVVVGQVGILEPQVTVFIAQAAAEVPVHTTEAVTIQVTELLE
jgi:hypothetical protein